MTKKIPKSRVHYTYWDKGGLHYECLSLCPIFQDKKEASTFIAKYLWQTKRLRPENLEITQIEKYSMEIEKI